MDLGSVTVMKAEFITWTMIISYLISLAISAALSAAAMLLAPKPKKPSEFSTLESGSMQTVRQAIAHWRIVYGEVRVPGVPIYIATSAGESGANGLLHEVVAFAAHEIAGFGTILVNERPSYAEDRNGDGDTLDGWFGSLGTGGRSHLRIQTKLGTADQTAFADLTAALPEWTADHRAAGHALVWARYNYATGVYLNQMPNLTAVVRGKKVYDPRDLTTKFSNNPALCIRDYLLDTTYGLGCEADEIDETSFAAAANVCDEFVNSPTTGETAVMHNASSVDATADVMALDGKVLKLQRGDRCEVTSTGAVPSGIPSPAYAIPHREFAQWNRSNPSVDKPPAVQWAASYADALAGTAVDITDAGSGTITVTKTGEPRYTLNGSFTTDQAPRGILEDMLSSCAGRLAYSGGKFRLLGLAWAAPSLTLDEEDLRGPMKVQTKRSRRDRFNAVKGTYANPLNQWQPSDYPAVTSETYETQDGGQRIFAELALPFTTRAGMAQRLAKIALVRNRFERVVTYPAKLAGYDCKPGEIIAIDNDRWSWSGKTFEVLEWKPTMDQGDEGGAPYPGVDLVLNESDESIFDWASTEERADPPVIPPTLPDWQNLPPPGSPAVSEENYEGRDGSDVKTRVTLAWEASDSALVLQYETQFSPAGLDEWQQFAAPTAADVLTATHPDFTPGTWDFRVRGKGPHGVDTEWATTSGKVIVGLSADPVAITGLGLQKLGGQAILKWDLHADADVRRGGYIEFRHGPDPAETDPANTTTIGGEDGLRLGRDTIAALPLKEGTYFARAIDKLGNKGPWASVSTDGATILAYSTIGSIVEHSAFAGTLDGLFLSGGGLTLDGALDIDDWGDVDDVDDWDSEGGIATSGTYAFSAYLDSGTTTAKRLRGHIAAQVFNQLDTIGGRTALISTWESFVGATAPGAADAWVEFRETNDNPAGTPTWSAWQRLDVTEVTKRYAQLRAQLRSYDPAYNVLVTELAAYYESI